MNILCVYDTPHTHHHHTHTHTHTTKTGRERREEEECCRECTFKIDHLFSYTLKIPHTTPHQQNHFLYISSTSKIVSASFSSKKSFQKKNLCVIERTMNGILFTLGILILVIVCDLWGFTTIQITSLIVTGVSLLHFLTSVRGVRRAREFQIISPASHHALRHLNIYIIHSTYSNAIKALECVNTQLALRARTQVPGNLAWKATLYLVGTVRGVCENFNHIPQISL